MSDIEVPVLIAGGGGAGLVASALLSRLGVDSLLVSRHAETSVLPKAHILSQRTMEILRELGVAEEIYARGAPPQHMKATAWYAGLAGDTPDYGRELGRLEVWGAGYEDPDYIAASSCRTTNLPQIRLEPILRAHAEALAPGSVRFHHELLDLIDDEDGVRATVRNRDDGTEFTVRARYLLGADGGRTVGPSLGVAMQGQTDIMRMVTTHFAADLSPWARDPEVLIRWMVNPDFGGSFASGVLVPMGPDHWGPDSEEWVFHLQFAVDDAGATDPERVLERMRATLGLPDFDPEILNISQWIMEGVVAERFRVGNCFLLGDAAHRHPPTGGLGLNSAIQDAHNLCWKLAEVLGARADDALLDSYETERRPVDQANTACSVGNAMNHFTIDAALGLSPEASAEANWEAVRPLWEERPTSLAKRHALTTAICSQTMEFRHHHVDFGYAYAAGAFVPDETLEAPPLDSIRLHEPSTRPGHSLPHAFIERAGVRFSLAELVGDGRFLLIAGEDGEAWCEAAREAGRRTGVSLDAITVGVVSGDYVDIRCAWLKQRGVSPTGAVLVRPDRFVAWRSPRAADDPADVLEEALRAVLARPGRVPQHA